MKEASPAKYYLAKYFFLAFGALQWMVGGVIFTQSGSTPKGQFTVFLFFTIGLLFFSLFLLISGNFKRVAVSKKKVTVIEPNKKQNYEWPQIKSIKFIPLFNLYRMKIKGRKGKIYFLPTENSEIIYGMFPSAPGLEGRKMKV